MGDFCMAGTNGDDGGVSRLLSTYRSLPRLLLCSNDESDEVDAVGVPRPVELGLFDANLPWVSQAYRCALFGVARILLLL